MMSKYFIDKNDFPNVGEHNQENAADYGCAIREMVNDWRKKWYTETDSMDPQFPFGQVQVKTFADTFIFAERSPVV